MPVLGLLYPGIVLSREGDPLRFAGNKGDDDLPDTEAVLDSVAERLKERLGRITERVADTGSAREDEAWYWAAPILLDLEKHPEETRDWWADPELAERWSGESGEEGWNDHVEEAQKLIHGEINLGQPPKDLPRILAKLALAGPAICAFRSLSRVVGEPTEGGRASIRHAAGKIAWGFRTLFNLPISINLIRGLKPGRQKPFWEQVLDYSLAGCLQSVLDEYSHVLRESLGLIDVEPKEAAGQIADVIANSVGIHAATPQVDEIQAKGSGVALKPHRLRARYAMRFGDEVSDATGDKHRGEQVREAFNSPFRPFVLVTTSVGQEGLDFHPFCHAVVHWNLPRNPVDFEQREGRVHRYKGHAVRRNIAQQYGQQAIDLARNDENKGAKTQPDPWKVMFDLASKEPRSSDLTPFWIYPKGQACIERHVPMLAMSREIGRLANLRNSLALYRMVFGQPRQEDLLEHLLKRLPKEKIQAYLNHLQINLTPPSK